MVTGQEIVQLGSGGSAITCHGTMEELQAQIKSLKATVADLREREKSLQATVAAQEGTISQLCGAGPERVRRADGAAGRRPHIAGSHISMPIDVVLGSWCESGVASYGEFLRMAETCTSWRRRVLYYLRLLRTLDLRCVLNVPPVRTAEDQRRHQWKALYERCYSQYVASVGNALDRMGGSLKELHLRRDECFACSVTPESGRDVAIRLTQLAKRTPMMRIESLTWSLGIVPFATTSDAILGSLRKLDLSGNNLGDEGCKLLAVVLLKDRNDRKDASGGSACGCGSAVLGANLCEINLTNNSIRELGFGYLSFALRRLPSLRHLVVGSNCPGRNGCASLGNLVSAASQLETLGLEECNLGRSTLSQDLFALERAIADGQGYPNHSDLGWGGGGTTGGLGRLKHLGLRGNVCKEAQHVVRGQALSKLLHRLPQLESLDMSCCQLSEIDCEHLALGLHRAAASVRRLDLSWNLLNATSVVSLSSCLACKMLRDLDLSDNPHLGDAGCRALAEAFELKGATRLRLESLRMSHTDSTDLGCGLLVRALAKAPALRRLDLARNHITERGARGIGCVLLAGGLGALTVLNLDGNGIACSWRHQLAVALKALKSYGCSHEVLRSSDAEECCTLVEMALEPLGLTIEHPGGDALWRVRQLCSGAAGGAGGVDCGDDWKRRLAARGIIEIPDRDTQVQCKYMGLHGKKPVYRDGRDLTPDGENVRWWHARVLKPGGSGAGRCGDEQGTGDEGSCAAGRVPGARGGCRSVHVGLGGSDWDPGVASEGPRAEAKEGASGDSVARVSSEGTQSSSRPAAAFSSPAVATIAGAAAVETGGGGSTRQGQVAFGPLRGNVFDTFPNDDEAGNGEGRTGTDTVAREEGYHLAVQTQVTSGDAD